MAPLGDPAPHGTAEEEQDDPVHGQFHQGGFRIGEVHANITRTVEGIRDLAAGTA